MDGIKNENDSSILSEYGAVGSFLIDARALAPLRSEATEEDFQTEYCKEVFHAACQLADNGESLDAFTISSRVPDVPRQFLMELMDITPTAAHVQEYGRAVHNNAAARAVADLGNRIADVTGNTLTDVLNDIRSTIDAVMPKKSVVSSGECLGEFLEKIRKISKGEIRAALKTGYDGLDAVLGGGVVQEGLYILAARPAIGKTTVALALAEAMAEADGTVAFFSMEMSSFQISARRVARASGIGISRYTVSGIGTDCAEDWAQTMRAVSVLSKHEVYVFDRPHQSVAEIELQARNIQGLQCIFIDYLGLINHKGGKSLYEQVTGTSNALKRMARSVGVPVICLAQLNRETEKSKGTKPTLSDLRDSGAIEQDADAVILLSRAADDFDGFRTLRADVAKNRHGATGEILFELDLENGRLSEKLDAYGDDVDP